MNNLVAERFLGLALVVQISQRVEIEEETRILLVVAAERIVSTVAHLGILESQQRISAIFSVSRT